MPAEFEANGLLGVVLNIPFDATFVDGTSMRTCDGGCLVFQAEKERDPADGPPTVNANCVAALAQWPNRVHAEDAEVFALTTAFTDVNGRLWQRTRSISVYEIWAAVLETPVLYQWESPLIGNPERRTQRVLVEPIETLCDLRENHLIEVIREKSNSSGPVIKQAGSYEDIERLLFRFRFKYFGAAIGLIEDRPASHVHETIQRICNGRLLVTIHPRVDADLIVALDQRDKILQGAGVRLRELGTLCSCELRLGAGWDQPAWDLPQRGDPAAWQREFRQTGVEPSSLLAFKPNPSIRYVPCRED